MATESPRIQKKIHRLDPKALVISGKPKGRARKRDLWIRGSSIPVGFICEPDGKGLGYALRFPGDTEWLPDRPKTLKGVKLLFGQYS